MPVVDFCFRVLRVRLRLRSIVFLFLSTITLWITLFSPYALFASAVQSVLTPPSQHPQQYPLQPNPPPLPAGTTTKPVPKEDWASAKLQVRNAFKHALDGYLKQAYPYDELRALSGGGKDKFNGWGVTLYDSLDTMWIMDLKEEFNYSLSLISKQEFAPANSYSYAPFFETVIRYLGGLLSAYALSKDPILLAQADDLGMKLLPVFNGTKSGLPAYSVHTTSGLTHMGWSGTMVLFAEAASCQMEYKYLAKLTGRREYYEKVERVMDIIYSSKPKDGLFVDRWTHDGRPTGGHHTVGASADSGYEYLLKQWLLMADIKAHDQYLVSIQGVIDNLLYLSPIRHLLYVTDTAGDKPTYLFEHLSCFLPGLLALGAHTLPPSSLSPKSRERHKWAAEGLAYSCYIMYADQRSGLGPDGVRMSGGEKWVDTVESWERKEREGGVPPGLGESGIVRSEEPGPGPGPGSGPGVGMGRGRGGQILGVVNKRDYLVSQQAYYLRPETIESLYILYKTTGDNKWRERGWEIFQAIEKNARTKYGYGSVSSVDRPPHLPMDDMPSFFLAETLKYLYLLFDDTDVLPLDKWVFNTEAHPFPVFEWTAEERERFGMQPLDV